MSDPIIIAPYNPEWAGIFQTARGHIVEIFAGHSVTVEHIGSTSVPGLGAKPIIDIMLGAESLSVIENHIPGLEALGYEYVPEFNTVMPERRYFRRHTGEVRTHHLHAVLKGGMFWQRHTDFRDILRTHPMEMRAYEQLKQNLAKQFQVDVAGYTDAKTDFIQDVLRRYARGNAGSR